MIVVDASVLVTALGVDGVDGRRIRARFSGERLVAPAVVDLEVVAAFRRLHAAGRLDGDRAAAAVADLRALHMRRVPHRALLDRCWELRDKVTPYDAAYIALAESLQATLLTADRRLTRVPGVSCTFELAA